MKRVYIIIGKDKILSQISHGSELTETVRKGDYVYPLHNAKKIYIYDKEELKLYETKITDGGKYKTPTLVTDESMIDIHPPKVVVDSTNRGEWVLSTQSRHSDMSETTVYMSNSNYNINSKSAWVKVSFKGLTSLNIKYGSNAESAYDYVQIWHLDRDITSYGNTMVYSTNTDPQSTSCLLFTRSKQSTIAPNLEYTFTCGEGEHFFWVNYCKDGSISGNEDRGYIGFPTELIKSYGSINVPYYTISKTEYIKDGDKYYEKLTYSEDASTRKGNEYTKTLSETSEIIQIGDKKYNCNYYYITLYGGEVVKTDLYELGDEIFI